MQKDTNMDNNIIEEELIEDVPVEKKPTTSIIKIGDKSTENKLNKFDVFFIRVWAFFCSIVSKLTIWVCKGLGLIFKKEIPKKYVAAVIATILVIIAIAIITAPFTINVTKMESLDLYPNNLIAVQKTVGRDTYLWGFADKNGKIKIECQYEDVMDFKYGVAFVKIKRGEGDYYWTLINKRGKLVNKDLYIQDYAGTTIAPVQQFSDDTKLARIQGPNQKFGYINNRGTQKIAYIYEDAGVFKEGMARVSTGGESYFINKKGNRVSEIYKDARDMVEGRAAVCTTGSGKWGFVDEKGNMVVEPTWDAVSDYKNGYAAVKNGGTYGVIDLKGNIVVKAEEFVDLKIREYFGLE